MRILELVTGEKAALEKEQEWIRHFVKEKMPLFNVEARSRKYAPVYIALPQENFIDAIRRAFAQNEREAPEQVERTRDPDTEAPIITRLKAGKAKGNSIKVAACSHVLAAQVQFKQGRPIADTLAALAAHFQVEDISALPEQGLPAVLAWFANLLES